MRSAAAQQRHPQQRQQPASCATNGLRPQRGAAAPHSSGSSRSGGRRHVVAVRALGFDFGDTGPAAAAPPRPSPSKAFAAFTLRASSLLVYQHVFKGAVGEALLALLVQAQKFQGSNKEIVAAYCKFYSLLMLSGYDCWRDYVTDQILLGRDNPFARAVAQGQVQAGAPILQAAAYDLDMLQGLAVPLTTLAEYIGEAAPTAGDYWVSAASATSVARPSSGAKAQLPGGTAPLQPVVVLPGAAGAPGAVSSAGDGSGAAGAAQGTGFIGPPPSPEELAQWRAALAGHDAWSSALPLLQQYYLQHGFGVTSRNATLRWSKGGFEEASEGGLARDTSLPGSNPASALAPPMAAAGRPGGQQAVLSALQGPFQALADNTRRHCAGLPAEHAVVCGVAGSGKSWLLWEGTLLAGRDAGLRLVEVPAAEVPNLLDIARGCARYPRVHFILVVDQLELPLRGGADLLTALGASGGSGWPANTLLYVGASAASTVARSDPLVARCSLVVPLSPLEDAAAYLQAVRELTGSSEAGADAGELERAALEWAHTHGYSVRSAATFVRHAAPAQ